MNLAGVAEEIQHRLIHIFSRDEHGRRAVNGGNPKLNRDPNFRDYVHFYEVSVASDRADRSFSTVTTVEAWVHRIRRDGRVLSRGVSCRLENSVDCLGRPRVSQVMTGGWLMPSPSERGQALL